MIKNAPPRRVWDLYANWVVPFWVAGRHPWVISHAWVDDNKLKNEITSINGYEWPVPMPMIRLFCHSPLPSTSPKDADLDLIRIEMLNLGAEYAWLDVLCLRQKGQDENPRRAVQITMRKEEWKVDVPMIGWVYGAKAQPPDHLVSIVCYFSGLGLPLSFKTASNFEDDRCWFNRAWTLQETPCSPIIAGKTCDDGMIDERFMTRDMQRIFHRKLASLQQLQERTSIFDILLQMRKRKSTKPVDKIAGLVYLLESSPIPKYNAGQCEEDTWTELVDVMHYRFRAALFFLYPKPGKGNQSWRPSWEQVIEGTLPAEGQPTFKHLTSAFWMEKGKVIYDGPRIDGCTVHGLADPSEDLRHGEVKNGCGVMCTFYIVTDPAGPIDDGQYTLIGYVPPPSVVERIFWVIRKMEEPNGGFRKMSVLRMANIRESEKIRSLNVYRRTKTSLL
ncbi:hypothetical protein ARMSODRAFT_899720 [Armillaria solidipes]|uniref:Heterokaryon incompatibility domain-containing protein n=1 Tax=Armillaria solidipes TaxID=1076256 RepID=A0A2H3AZC7_9AGAR|nr:hypothetical protein ARMSODRAFT_899720 [Armillaria solidipes]